MNNASENELRAIAERNESRAHWSAFLVVIGLVAETVLAACPASDPKIEHWAPVIADALIALGVAGEILFSGRAAKAQKELLSRVENKLANALDRASAAQEELRKFRIPRATLLTRAVVASITEKLKPFVGTEFDCGMSADGEQADFLWNLQPALVAAGWKHLDWQYPPGPLPMLFRQGLERPPSGNVSAANVEIHLHSESRERLLPAATALINALNELGIAARDAGYNTHSINNAAMHILIGPKG